jgi:predicted nucleic acid-binding protein
LIIDAFRTLSFLLTPTASLLPEAYRLAVAHQRTVYDAMYLALSVQENCPFVTADEKMVNALGSTFPKLAWVGNWP